MKSQFSKGGKHLASKPKESESAQRGCNSCFLFNFNILLVLSFNFWFQISLKISK